MVDEQLRAASAAGETLHAPDLLRYEAASALTRAVAAGHLEADQVPAARERISGVELTLHPLEDGVGVVALAVRLQRSSAYDAAYVALAQSLDADAGRSSGS